MTARDFCYWLQGYFEIAAGNPHAGSGLSFEQIECVKRHLEMVFVHDLDPKAGGKDVQDVLNHLHAGKAKTADFVARC
jgi:hypothetical protein